MTLEINPDHFMMIKLNQARKIDSRNSSLVVRQILDNCLLASHINTDP